MGRGKSFSSSAVWAQQHTAMMSAIVFFAAHIPLALLMRQFSLAATAHALGTLMIGLWWAASGRRGLERVVYLAAYIVGAEVLWRMTNAQVFWEFGKYATSVIFIVAILRNRLFQGSILMLLYFELLLPSAALTLVSLDFAAAQDHISFNLSGPLALTASAWFFSHLQLSSKRIQRLFIVVIGPVVGAGTIALYATMTNSNIVFENMSNKVTSGGFGPNQVAGALGLGTLLALLCVINDQEGLKYKFLMLGTVVFLAVQSALTFSRGGLYNAVGAALLASWYLLRDARSRAKFILVIGVLFIVANFILLPYLDTFTGGAFSTRFQNTNLTKRDVLILGDLKIWDEHPVLGIGVGQADIYREQFFRRSAAHTEFTRLLAEHGIFGLGSIALLLIAGAQNLRRGRTAKEKAIIASLIGWSFLFMLDKAMRLVAPSFIFGLTFATFLLDAGKDASPPLSGDSDSLNHPLKRRSYDQPLKRGVN